MINSENIKFAIFSLVSLCIAIFTTYLLSNYFSIEDFGKIQFLLTIIGVLSIFYFSGFDIIIQKKIFKNKDRAVLFVFKKIIPIGFVLLWSVVFCSYCFFQEYFELIFLGGIVVTIGMFDRTSAIMNSKLAFKNLRYVELVSKILILVLVIFVVFFSVEIEQYLIFFAIASGVILLGRIFYSMKQLDFINSDTNIDYTLIVREGTSTALSTSYTILTSWIERVILGFISLELLAIFVIGQLFPKVVKDNVKILLVPTLNTWASKGFEYYGKMIEKYQLKFYMLGIFSFVVLYFLIELIIENLFLKYQESILIAQILSITLIFKFVETIKISSIALSEHTHIFNKINNITNTIKISFVIILVPLFEVYGAVFSIVIVEILRFFLIVKEFKKL